MTILGPRAHVLRIPAGTPASQCRSRACRATIYWIAHPTTGRLHPVDCAYPDGAAPTATEDGQGVSHFATCPDAPHFRRARRPSA